MRVYRSRETVLSLLSGVLLPLAVVTTSVHAERFNSSSYQIDASVGNSFGGASSSTGYKLTSSGGEAIVGDGSSGSYKLTAGYVAQTEQSIQLNVQPSSLLAEYPMDEIAGTGLVDSSINSSNASTINAPTRLAGKIGQAVDYNGTTQTATAGGQRTLDVDVGESKTISIWVKPDVQTAEGFAVAQIANCKGWGLSLLTSGDVRLTFSASNTGCTSPSVSTADTSLTRYDNSAWHHIVGVIDRPSGIIKIFVDGQLQNTVSSINNTLAANDGNLTIAGKGDGTGFFNGSLDQAMVYDVAYSDKQVARLYAAQNTGTTSSLSLPDVTPNTSSTINANAIVQTDAPSYTIAIAQNQNLTSGGNTISPISGDIGTPALWTEGTTKGFGFSLISGPGLDAKWGTNPNYKYAPFPGSSTSMYSRTGYTGGVKDVIGTQYRVDVPLSLPAGDYGNTITYTATIVP